jgi:hypothetical protein
MKAKIPAFAFLALAALLNGCRCDAAAQARTYPPVSGSNIGEFRVDLFLSCTMTNVVQQSIDEINGTLAQRNDVRAKVSLFQEFRRTALI